MTNPAAAVSHNLLGQRLGRKGRDTRERILAATERLLAAPPGTPITLSAVAREASLAMTTLYLYFADLSELLGAVLEPVMASADESYVARITDYWPDDALSERCLAFIESYHEFWVRHTRILHLRNHYADNDDARMRSYRNDGAKPLIQLIASQMDREGQGLGAPAYTMATVLLTGIERMITVATDETFQAQLAEVDGGNPLSPCAYTHTLLEAEARLLELAIADGRAAG